MLITETVVKDLGRKFTAGEMEDSYWDRKKASDEAKILCREHKIEGTWLRKDWVPIARFLHLAKKSKIYKKEGFTNFKLWIKKKTGLTYRYALYLAKIYKEFEGTDVLHLAYRKVRYFLMLPERYKTRLRKKGQLAGLSLEHIDSMAFDVFEKFVYSLIGKAPLRQA